VARKPLTETLRENARQVQDLAGKVSKDAAWGVYGVVLIALVFAMPGGAMRLIAKARAAMNPTKA